MENTRMPQPPNLDHIFGPDSYDPAVLPYFAANQSALERNEAIVKRALEHRANGKSAELIDPKTGTPIDTYIGEDGIFYRVNGHEFPGLIFTDHG